MLYSLLFQFKTEMEIISFISIKKNLEFIKPENLLTDELNNSLGFLEINILKEVNKAIWD